jgi:hypothetical protein
VQNRNSLALEGATKSTKNFQVTKTVEEGPTATVYPVREIKREMTHTTLTGIYSIKEKDNMSIV